MQSILDAINEWIKEILIGAINGNLSTMFGDVNEKVGTIAAEVGRTPQAWNANVFSMIRALSENVCLSSARTCTHKAKGIYPLFRIRPFCDPCPPLARSFSSDNFCCIYNIKRSPPCQANSQSKTARRRAGADFNARKA